MSKEENKLCATCQHPKGHHSKKYRRCLGGDPEHALALRRATDRSAAIIKAFIKSKEAILSPYRESFYVRYLSSLAMQRSTCPCLAFTPTVGVFNVTPTP